MKTVHTPVLLQPVVAALDPAPGKRYIDATLGAGGHTLALLERGAEVAGIDRDSEVMEIAVKRITDAGFESHFTPVNSSFSQALTQEANALNGEYDGILLDLGVSSYQFDTPARGFSFRFDAPLDMRMDQNLAVTAADLVNGLGRKELAELFQILGEEARAGRIASAIVETRKLKPIKTTFDLVKVVEMVIPRRFGHIHPATKVFQALRMAVNSEREELKAALPSALSWLAMGGVLAVISFHSLEDKIVKDFMREHEEVGMLVLDPGNPVSPDAAELSVNPRSRSAKLRIARKISGVNL